MIVPVEQYYSREYLLENILARLESAGIDKSRISRKDLVGFDEFHVRGLEVTKELAAGAGLQKDMKILDVGCGIGGPCRFIADEYGCETTGIDITYEYIRAAIELTELAGLGRRCHFIHASALQLPFAAASFDMVWTQHVQMNIGDKKQFYSEIRRVLKPGGRFIYYDIFSTAHQPIRYPVPWAEDPSLSHLITVDELHTLLKDAGLDLLETKDQTAAGINFLNNTLEKIKQKGGVHPLSLQLLMGSSFQEKLENLRLNLSQNKIWLESGICSRV